MPRSNSHQPITGNVNNLVIGTPQMRVKQIDGVNLTNATADATTSPLLAVDTVGSLQSASLAADAQFKTHSSGFPALEDARLLEQNNITYTMATEELLSEKTVLLLKDILGQIGGAAAKRYAVEMRVEKYAGGGVSYYSGNSQLKPQLSISTQDDWIGAELTFESLLKSSYSNQDLCYRANFSGSARSRTNQAATVDPDTLCIGFAQVRMGKPTPKPVGSAAIGTERFFSGVSSTTVAAAMSASGTYTGTVSGGVVVQVERTPNKLVSAYATVSSPGSTPTFDMSTATGDNTLTFVVDGTDTYAVTFTDSATLSVTSVVSEINAAGPGTPASLVDSFADRILISNGTSIQVTVPNTSLGFTVDGAPPTASKFKWISETGQVTTGVTVTGAAQLLGSGVSVTFSSTTAQAPLDTWVIPVVSSSAKTADPAASSVNSNWPYLSNADSIGAVQAVSLSAEASLKPHYAGFPLKKDAEILESSTITLDISAEEFNYAAGALTKGAATTLSDMLFDSSVNGSRYHAPFEMIIEGINGDVLSFWIPNGEIIGNLEVSPSDDWAAVPFQVAAQIQSADMFHATATVPDIISLYNEDLS